MCLLRGYGIGREIFSAGKDFFRKYGTEYIGLDSVAEQRVTYERRGFIETNLIAICERPSVKAIPVANGSLMEGERIEYLQKLSLDKLAESDFAHCGLERPRLWTTEALFHRQDANGLAVVDQHEPLRAGFLFESANLDIDSVLFMRSNKMLRACLCMLLWRAWKTRVQAWLRRHGSKPAARSTFIKG